MERNEKKRFEVIDSNERILESLEKVKDLMTKYKNIKSSKVAKKLKLALVEYIKVTEYLEKD